MNNFDPSNGQPINNNQQNTNNQNNGYNQPNNGYNQQYNNYNQPNNGYSQQYNNYNQPNNGYNQPNNGYNQPNNGYNAPNVPGGGLPIKNRNIALFVILSIVTCGIYGYYWLYCVNEDVNKSLNEQDMSGGMVILLTIVTCGIYGIIWAYQTGNKITKIKRMMGDQYAESNLGVLYLVLSLFVTFIVPLALAQNELNKYASIRE